MSLTPTKDDTATKVIFNKKSGGDAAMPSTIIVYVESLPMLRGVCRKKIYTPYFNAINTAAVQTTYEPDSATSINLQSAYRDVVVPMQRLGSSTAGIFWYVGKTLSFIPTAVNEPIQMAIIDIETLTY